MGDPERVIATAIVLAGLTTGSIFFNKYIDRLHELNNQRKPDGATALWVASGVIYTLGGAAVLVAIWANQMPQGWLMAGAVLVLHLLAFLASGIPMLWGDINRSAVIRTLRHARKTLRD